MSSSHHNNADAKTCQIGGDIMLVLDTSDSMNQPTQNGGQSKLQAAVAAAKTFVNIVASYNNNNRIGLVTFDVTAQVKQTLTTNYSSVLNALNVLGSTEYRTCTQCGIDSTNTTFQNNPRAGVNKIAVMLTDGLANWCSGWPLSNSLDSTKGQVCALQSAQNAYATTGTNYFTIGLGQNVNSSFLQQIVSDTGGVGQYYFSPTTNQLQQIYTKISKSCLPSPPPISPTPGGPTSTPVPTPSSFSISGNVYVDTNGDQTYTTPPDNSYTSGTSTIYIYNHSTGALVKKLSTTNGAYTSGNILAAGTYDVKYTPLAPGYYVSYPLTTSPPSYTVTTGVNCDPGNYNDVTCINGSVDGVDFGINNAVSWIQSVCGDIRSDNGIIDHIPSAPSCGGTSAPYAITTNNVCTNNPGIAYTGSTNADYGLNGGQAAASPYNRTVGGSAYPEVFKPSTSNIVHTSYAYMTAKVRQSGIATTDLSTICSNLSNCTLPSGLTHGIYTASSDVALNAFTAPTNPPQNYVFLINGNLTLNGNISIPQNSGSTITFSVKGNTTVAANVGNGLNAINLDNTSQQTMLNLSGSTTYNTITKDPTTTNSQNASNAYNTVTLDTTSTAKQFDTICSSNGNQQCNYTSTCSTNSENCEFGVNGCGNSSSGNNQYTCNSGSWVYQSWTQNGFCNYCGAGSYSTSTTLSWSHTLNANPNRLLVVSVSIGSTTASVTSVTYKGTNLTKLTALNYSNGRDELWYLKEQNLPSTPGSYNIIVRVGGLTGNGAPSITAGAATYYNVDQTANTFGTPVTNSGSTTTPSVTVNAQPYQLVIDSLSRNGNTTYTVGAGQRSAWNIKSPIVDASSYQTGGGSTVLSWSSSSTVAWGDIGVAINPTSLSITGSTLSWTHTVGTQSNPVIVVGVALGDSTTSVSSIKCVYASSTITLTPLSSVNFTNGRDEMWYYKSPPSGSCTMTVNITGGSPAAVAAATTYYHVDSTIALTGVSNSGSGTTASVTVGSNANQLVVDNVAYSTNASLSVGGGQTQEWNISNPIAGAGSYESGGTTGGTSTLMSWTTTSSKNWGEIGVALTPTTTTSNPQTSWNYTIGGENNRILLVGLALNNNTSKVLSVNYGSTSLQNLSAVNCTSNTCRDEVWYAKEANLPAAGSYPITVTVSGNADVEGGAASFYNVDQTATLTPVTKSGNNNTFSVNVTSTATQLVFDTLAGGGNGNWNPSSGQTTLWEINTSQFSGSSYQQGGANSTTMSWTNDTGNDAFAEIAVALNETSSAGGGSASTNLDGFYSTDGSFIINSNGTCDTIQLQIGGSIIVGAGLQGGTFQNNRNLCSQNASCPSVTFTQRPDLLLNAPDFIKTTNHVWQEVAP